MDTSRLDLNLLVTLEALLSERNVTKAAARLHLSQPAVSAQLARLRQAFDDPLLLPAQRGMTPTARALALLEPLRQSLDQVRAAVSAQAAFDPATAEMTVSIAASDYLQSVAVQPLVLRLRKQAPGLRVAVRVVDHQHLEAQMRRGEVDLALLQPIESPEGLRMRPLLRETYVLIARKRHPLLRDTRGNAKSAFTLRDIGKLEHVVVSPAGGRFDTPVDHALAALGQRRRVVLSAASFLFVPEIVAKSDLVALVPARLVRGRAAGLVVMAPPFPVDGFDIAMVWHERNHGHPAQRWLRETLLESVPDA